MTGLQEFADRVIHRGLYLLNTRNVITADYERVVNQLASSDLATVVAEHPYRKKSALACLSQCSDNVPRTAAGGDSDGNVGRACMCDQLPQEDNIGADIVGQRRDVRRF